MKVSIFLHFHQSYVLFLKYLIISDIYTIFVNSGIKFMLFSDNQSTFSISGSMVIKSE